MNVLCFSFVMYVSSFVLGMAPLLHNYIAQRSQSHLRLHQVRPLIQGTTIHLK